MSALPFRDSLRVAPGAPRPAEDEIRQIQRETPHFRTEDLERWTHHPDERVPLLLLQARGPAPLPSPFTKRLWVRAMHEARNEGVYWTPLLDQLASLFLWPQDWKSPDWKDARVQWAEQPPPPPLSPEAVYAPLLEWAAGGPPEEEMLRLGAFRHSALFLDLARTVAARQMPLSPELIRGLFAHWTEWRHFLHHPALDEASAQAILSSAQEQLQGKGTVGYGAAVEALGVLSARGFAIPEDSREQIQGPVRLLGRRVRSAENTRRRDLVEALERLPSPPSSWWEGLYGLLAPEPALLRRALRHPRAGLPLMGSALQPGAGDDVWEEVARRPEARAHPGIRRKLEASGRAVAQEHLLADLPPESFGESFARLATLSPEHALRALERSSRPQASAIPRSCIGSLLQSEQADIRLRTAALLWKTQAPAPPPGRGGLSR